MSNDIRLWSPNAQEIEVLETELVRTFWEAFSAPPYWNGLKIGSSPEQANTAWWFVNRLLTAGQKVVLASGNAPGKDLLNSPILGFAFGGILNEELFDWFQLAEFGATKGDGVLPFAGVVPLAQGYRISDDCQKVLRDSSGMPIKDRNKGKSLYRRLFEQRLGLAEIASCRKVFLRTRQVLSPVIAMATSHGFKYQGSFYTIWQGVETQDRMVFCLER